MPWALGPPDGRYLMRREDAGPGAPPTHVLVFATLGAPERRRLVGRRSREAPPEPDPTPVATGRATIISTAQPLPDAERAQTWLREAGEEQLTADLAILNQALHAYRLITADPYLPEVGRAHVLVARVGYGAGDEVADGRWSEARELVAAAGRERRARVLQPQARLAAVLGRRERSLACEELALRAHADVAAGRLREAALQVLVALDAALAELSIDPLVATLGPRLAELEEQREAVMDAAQAALSGEISAVHRQAVEFALARIEAALRARAVGNA